MSDLLERFVSARRTLMREREEIAERIRGIDEVLHPLGPLPGPRPEAVPVPPPPEPSHRPQPATTIPRASPEDLSSAPPTELSRPALEAPEAPEVLEVPKAPEVLEAPEVPKAPEAPEKAGRTRRNTMTLREAITRITVDGPRTKKEILEGILALGYSFRTKKPENTLSTVLYNKKHFSHNKGLFGPAESPPES